MSKGIENESKSDGLERQKSPKNQSNLGDGTPDKSQPTFEAQKARFTFKPAERGNFDKSDHACTSQINHGNAEERENAAVGPKDNVQKDARHLVAPKVYYDFSSGLAKIDQQIKQLHSSFRDMQDTARTTLSDYLESNFDQIDTDGGAGELVKENSFGQLEEILKPDGFEMVVDNVVGRVLRATRDFEAGEVVLQERPLVLIPASCLVFGGRDDFLKVWRKLKTQTRATLRQNFETHVDAIQDKEASKAFLLSHDELQMEDADIHTDDILLLSQIVKVNGHQWGHSTAVFQWASKLCHCCFPSCKCTQWVDRESDRPQTLQIRTLRRIARGELLSISYLPKDLDLFADTAWRRKALQSSKFFFCCCVRCVAPDKTRAIKGVCSCHNSEGFISPLEAASTIEKVPTLWRCSACGVVHRADSSLLSRVLQKEVEVTEKLSNLESKLGPVAASWRFSEEAMGNIEKSPPLESSKMNKSAASENPQIASNSAMEELLESTELLKTAQQWLGVGHWCVAKAAFLRVAVLFSVTKEVLVSLSIKETREALCALEVLTEYARVSCPELEWHLGNLLITAFLELLRRRSGGASSGLTDRDLQALLRVMVESGDEKNVKQLQERAPKAWEYVCKAVRQKDDQRRMTEPPQTYLNSMD